MKEKEYSEKEFIANQEKVKEWYSEFIESTQFDRLNDDEKEESEFII